MSLKVIDRNAIFNDERKQRLRRIELIERERPETAPIWAAKQASLYRTAIPISQTPTLGQVVTQKIQSNASYPDVLRQKAELKLKKVADAPNIEYIIDCMDEIDLKYLVNS